MKKILLFFFIAVVSSASIFAQTLTADEMISKANCATFDCYSEFISKKGFSYEASPAVENAEAYIFLSDSVLKTSNPNVRTKNTIMIIISKVSTVTNVGFRTADKMYYNKLLAAFQGKGFRSTKTIQNANGVTTVYESKNYPEISLTITVDKLGTDYTWTSYDFEVSKVRN